MSLNDTPSGERLHIGFFGIRNAGKSSLVNAVTGQDLAVVSDHKGTTTDPVQKAMELLPIGPVMIIDTPGYDDEGDLGERRVRKTRQILNRTDLAVLVVDGSVGLAGPDRELLALFREKEIPSVIVYNKSDLTGQACHSGTAKADDSGTAKADDSGTAKADDSGTAKADDSGTAKTAHSGTARTEFSGSSQANHSALGQPESIAVSARTGDGIHELKELLARIGSVQEKKQDLVKDLISPGDMILLVIPIDDSAPKGRLILPQQQMIRDILEGEAAAVCVKENDLPATLTRLAGPPALVITDSQAFGKVAADIPETIPLTSFSILMARYKGLLDMALTGVYAIDGLEDGDRILIAEGCTHHRQCEDIGTVKIPNWLRRRTGKDLVFETSSGRDFPEDLTSYSLIIHCGGCMLNEREVRYRMKCARDQGVPITNYGIAIAYMKGILERSIKPLGK